MFDKTILIMDMEKKSTSIPPTLLDILRVKYALAQVNIKRKQEYCYLKPKQMDCLQAVMGNHDILAVLPTSYGKSLIFELAPLVLDSMTFKSDSTSSTIIICPLDSIIKEQVDRYGQQAVHITSDFFQSNPCLEKFTQGGYKYIIGHPEHIVCKEAIEIFKTEQLQSKIKCIVVDEAHSVIQWGHDFRPKFKTIKNLRAVFPGVSMMALTATASPKMQEAICKDLLLHRTKFICANPDRPNVKLMVVRRPSPTTKNCTVEETYDVVFDPLIKELEEKGLSFPKTVVYAKLKWCGYGNHKAIRPKSEASGAGGVNPQHVSQYHAPCTQEVSFIILLLNVSVFPLSYGPQCESLSNSNSF